jgi:hypothetical protein
VQTTNIDLADLTQKQGYPAAISKMGDLAPAGSRAVIVVDNFLRQTGRETFKGENLCKESIICVLTKDRLLLLIHRNRSQNIQNLRSANVIAIAF